MTQYKTIPQQLQERKRVEFEMKIEAQFAKIKFDAVRIKERTDNTGFDNSIHWLITLNDRVKVEYSEGIGHFINSGHPLNNKLITEKLLNKFKSGQKMLPQDFYGLTGKDLTLFTRRVDTRNATIIPPAIKDVIWSLTMDASAVDEDFESWCSNFGYDTDSKKAEKLYNACRDSFAKLRSLGLNFDELQTYYEGY